MKELEIQVSVVVPVYNSEKYLEVCIKSIISQTYTNLDIILVNDGSDDCSGDICNKYAAIDSRITVVEQENKGAASARMYGTLKAKADFIVYVDSDDVIEQTYIQKMISENKDKKADIVIAQFISSNGDIYQDGLPCGRYIPKELIDLSIHGEKDFIHELFGFMHAKLFRTQIALRTFNHINNGIELGEDQDFGFCYFCYCNDICVIDFCGYFYRIRSNSVAHLDINQGKWLENYGKIYLSMQNQLFDHSCKKDLDIYVKIRIFESYMRVFSRLGIAYAANFPVFDIPEYENIVLEDKKIVIYGGGHVGQSYYLQLQKRGLTPVLWVDGNIKKYPVLQGKLHEILDLKSVKYEYILIAVLRKGTADSVKQKLIRMGICPECILWKKPLSLYFRD